MTRKAWIIGASTGIGAAVADKLKSKGWQVVRSSRSQGEIRVDISNDESVKQAAAQYEATYGAYDLVLVMAGFWQRMSAQNFDLEVFKEHNNTNTVGLARCAAAILPKMLNADSGTFMGVSSVAGFRGMPGSSGYGPSKAAQINFLESLRTDLVKSKVKIVTVSPGFVKTPMTDVNTFPMPFIISAERAAKIIVKGIEKQSVDIVFPTPMAITMKLARLVPVSIWPKLFKKG
ncbi:MAG: SDR family NAD(P)-dependent oxidoreductase [Candidatus Nanopelagicaceae bacterium]